MLENLPSPEVLLGIAAALAILVFYDVCYVWPIHRRISALTDRCAVVERSLGGLLGDLTRVSRRPSPKSARMSGASANGSVSSS
jgi:hypothetical protein